MYKKSWQNDCNWGYFHCLLYEAHYWLKLYLQNSRCDGGLNQLIEYFKWFLNDSVEPTIQHYNLWVTTKSLICVGWKVWNPELGNNILISQLISGLLHGTCPHIPTKAWTHSLKHERGTCLPLIHPYAVKTSEFVSCLASLTVGMLCWVLWYCWHLIYWQPSLVF